MKETRVPYKAPMIRAILAGLKSQTRRIAKGEPAPGGYKIGDMLQGQGGKPIKSPYGLPGDLMVATEAWRTVAEADELSPSELNEAHRIWYEADAPHQPGFGRYRPGMFMPSWASRIRSVITDVHVERLQDISELDAMAEGITCKSVIVGTHYDPGGHHEVSADRFFFEGSAKDGYESAEDAYFALWDLINGPDTHTLDPWVWVYTFNHQRK